MVVEALGYFGHGVHQSDAGDEARRPEASGDAASVSFPALELFQGGRDLIGCQQLRHLINVDSAAVRVSWQVVVGAAIVDGDRLLAAQRATPATLAGRWELPGGKVDAGETDEAALVRECREELGVDVVLGTRVGRDWPIGEHGVLRVWLASVVEGEPAALEHRALRWLTVDELHDVDWLAADLPVIDRLAGMLTTHDK